MALTERFSYQITILDDGQINYRRTRLLIDGEDTFEKHFRQVFEPGQDVSAFPAKLRNICAIVWTPQVIADYLAAKAARQTALNP
jgi:hypothetical protein